MELTSITLFGYPIVWIIIGWLVLALVIKIIGWLLEEWDEAQRKQEDESDGQYTIRRWTNRIQLIIGLAMAALIITRIASL